MKKDLFNEKIREIIEEIIGNLSQNTDSYLNEMLKALRNFTNLTLEDNLIQNLSQSFPLLKNFKLIMA